jgi:hypothetical protein
MKDIIIIFLVGILILILCMKNTTISNYIKPAEFKIGFTKPRPPYFMNNCNTNVLYPINGLKPEYGESGITDNDRCTEFIQPP